MGKCAYCSSEYNYDSYGCSCCDSRGDAHENCDLCYTEYCSSETCIESHESNCLVIQNANEKDEAIESNNKSIKNNSDSIKKMEDDIKSMKHEINTFKEMMVDIKHLLQYSPPTEGLPHGGKEYQDAQKAFENKKTDK